MPSIRFFDSPIVKQRKNGFSYYFHHFFFKVFGSFKKTLYLCIAIERETLKMHEDGPFVYRLVLKIFILARGVRFPHGLRKRAYQF